MLRELLADERADATIEYVLLTACVAVPLGLIAWGGVHVLSTYLSFVADVVGDPTP